MKPYYKKEGITIYHGDALDVLRGLPSESVHCCVTSPPYYGLRDYGVDGQIGLEPTPDEYVARLVEVFREVRRVLRDDGTLWLNLGDSYAGAGYSNQSNEKGFNAVRREDGGKTRHVYGTGLKNKDLIGIPWLVAFALRADGWYLRSEIIWHKPNPMPESVKDRPTKAHEQIFLLSKSPKYYYDADAVSESGAYCGQQLGIVRGKKTRALAMGRTPSGNETPGADATAPMRRNRRSVWTVTPKPYKEAHFATFPPDLIEPCILAGCPEGGTVLDPFLGSGTTAMVANQLRRNAVGIELNEKYLDFIGTRTSNIQVSLIA